MILLWSPDIKKTFTIEHKFMKIPDKSNEKSKKNTKNLIIITFKTLIYLRIFFKP